MQKRRFFRRPHTNPASRPSISKWVSMWVAVSICLTVTCRSPGPEPDWDWTVESWKSTRCTARHHTTWSPTWFSGWNEEVGFWEGSEYIGGSVIRSIAARYWNRSIKSVGSTSSISTSQIGKVRSKLARKRVMIVVNSVVQVTWVHQPADDITVSVLHQILIL